MIIMFIFFYSYLSPYLTYKIESSCKNLPSIYCKSRGLTRAFNLILKGEFQKALLVNKYSIRIFLFFIVQFLFRIIFLFIEKKFSESSIIKYDIPLSILLFVYSFYRLLPIKMV